jgi:hypothetical protein
VFILKDDAVVWKSAIVAATSSGSDLLRRPLEGATDYHLDLLASAHRPRRYLDPLAVNEDPAEVDDDPCATPRQLVDLACDHTIETLAVELGRDLKPMPAGCDSRHAPTLSWRR